MLEQETRFITTSTFCSFFSDGQIHRYRWLCYSHPAGGPSFSIGNLYFCRWKSSEIISFKANLIIMKRRREFLIERLSKRVQVEHPSLPRTKIEFLILFSKTN